MNLRNFISHYYETLHSGKKISIVYAFVKVKTCRHDTFVMNSGGALCEKMALIQKLELYTCWHVRLSEIEKLGKRQKRKSSLLNVLSAPRSCSLGGNFQYNFWYNSPQFDHPEDINGIHLALDADTQIYLRVCRCLYISYGLNSVAQT